MDSELFKQKDRGSRQAGKSIRAVSRAGLPERFPATTVGNRGRGDNRGCVRPANPVRLAAIATRSRTVLLNFLRLASQGGRTALAIGLSLWLSTNVHADDKTSGDPRRRLMDLSIEELMNESVTSVAKKETRLSESPAAIAVVSGDDVRRLGITSLPEALRWVPGMNVARSAGHTWAVSARGFQGEFANKLLVLIDGRSVYEPGFAGVVWDAQDVVMEDLDRIEVIRGPGATLWGANAVNGVVNIITKSAKETQGTLVSTAAGTEERINTVVRYGGQLATNLYYRVFVKYFNREGLVEASGRELFDDWNATRAGFRMDWEPSGENLFTLQGSFNYSETSDQYLTPILSPPFTSVSKADNHNNGGDVLARWTRTFSERSQVSVQSYYTHSQHGFADTDMRDDIVDVELQHRFGLASWNDVTWGAGYRYLASQYDDTAKFIWSPSERAMSLYTAFLQDDVTVVPERLHLILGSKFEHNDATGFEVQPGARLLWTPTKHQTAWGSISRAVRTPSRYERDLRLNVGAFQAAPTAPPVELALIGNPNLRAESLIAYELGYRIEPTRQLSFDVAGFYNVYDDLNTASRTTTNFEANPNPPHVLIGKHAANSARGRSYGVEVAVQYKVTDYWRVAADYSWLEQRLTGEHFGVDSPKHQARLRSYIELPWKMEFNTALSFVDELINRNTPSYVRTTPIPAYLRLDLGLVWHPTPNIEVGVWGQNLLDDRHPEIRALIVTPFGEVPRSVTGKVTWRF